MKMQDAYHSYTSRSLLVSKFVLFILAFLSGLLLVGCSSQSGGGPSVTATAPMASAALAPTLAVSTPTISVPDFLTPEPTPPMMDKVWQPPEPKKRVEMPSGEPTEIADSPDAMITYKVVGLAHGDDMKITKDGQVSVYGYRETVYTLKLSPERLHSLLAMFDRAHFFDLNDRYIQSDPPGVIAEIDYITITYNKDGRTKSIETRGSDVTPPSYQEVEKAVADLADEARKTGAVSKRPDSLVDYYLQGNDYTWWLDIDVEGGLYYGDNPARPHLSPEDLSELKAALESISNLSDDEWFTAPSDVRDTIFMSEHRAIVTTYKAGQQSQWINALSGATVPKGLQSVLDKLAEIYDKYAPVQ